MRDKNFVTLLDLFHQKYGKVVAAVMSVVSVLNDILWVPIALTGLGKWGFVCINLHSFKLCLCHHSKLVSNRRNHECGSELIFLLVRVDVGYCCHHLHSAGRSLLCGIYRCCTACPHLLQPGDVPYISAFTPETHWYSFGYNGNICLLFCILFQWICVPFVLINPHTMDISQTLINNTLYTPWIGDLQLRSIGVIADEFMCFVSRDYYSLAFRKVPNVYQNLWPQCNPLKLLWKKILSLWRVKSWNDLWLK